MHRDDSDVDEEVAEALGATHTRTETFPLGLQLIAPKQDAVQPLKLSEEGSIHATAAMGDIEKLKEALRHSVDLCQPDRLGLTPFMWAAAHGQAEAVRFLLTFARGTTVNESARSGSGETALHFASNNGHMSVARLLLENGADIDIKDAHGGTPLIYAANCGHASVVKLLIRNGADLTWKSNYGLSPLDYAILRGHTDVQLILEDYIMKLIREDLLKKTPKI